MRTSGPRLPIPRPLPGDGIFTSAGFFTDGIVVVVVVGRRVVGGFGCVVLGAEVASCAVGVPADEVSALRTSAYVAPPAAASTARTEPTTRERRRQPRLRASRIARESSEEGGAG